MTQLADGEWHRLHPATPLLKGGIAFLAILGVVIANMRERLIEFFVPQLRCPGPEEFCEDDPVSYVLDHYLLLTLVGIAVLLVLIVLGFWLSWRMHSFRITDELVEMRSGILFRSHRQARLDRIQGINVNRPLLARLFGVAKLEVSAAGTDASVALAYLSNANADGLRGEILARASGARVQEARAAADAAAVAAADDPAHAGLAEVARQRLAELTAPELDPALASPESVVKMDLGRLIGSTVLSSGTVIFLAAIAGVIVLTTTTDAGIYMIFGLIPIVIGFGSFLIGRILKSLRYSIAQTPHGVRVGFGLLSTTNDTLPPGRIHAVQITQELLWRPADWWMVRVNVASQSVTKAMSGQQNTTILPVGSRAEVIRVLELLLPELVGEETRATIEGGLDRARPGDGFTTSPRRGAAFRWFSWRRNGFLLRPDALLLRRGAVWRSLEVLPTARMQSLAAQQGPLDRALRLASVRVHTVPGPITAEIGALDAEDAGALFRDAAAASAAALRVDRSHRWGSA